MIPTAPINPLDPNKPPPPQTIGGGRDVSQYGQPGQPPAVAPMAAPAMSAGTPPMSTGQPPLPTTPMSPNQPNYAPQSVNPGNALPQFQQFADAAYQDATRRLDPQFEQADAKFRQQMVNRGLAEGTEAYDKARANFDMGKNDAYSMAQNQALLAGLGAQNQGWAQQFAQAQEGNRQGQFGDQFAFQGQRADMQDLMALLGYGQQTNANNNQMLNSDFNRAGGLFGLVPGMSPVQVDVMSPYQMQQQQNQFNSNQSANASNGFWGSVGQLGSAFLMSDRRVKTDIERVGTLDNGLPVYLFRYRDGGPFQIGVMAQDVQEAKPDAVRDFDGVLAVDYVKAVAA